MSISDFSHSAQIEINSISQGIRQSARGSLWCLIVNGFLKTRGCDFSDIEAYILACVRAKKAEEDWDQCPIDSDDWNEKADHARYTASVAGRLLKNLL